MEEVGESDNHNLACFRHQADEDIAVEFFSSDDDQGGKSK